MVEINERIFPYSLAVDLNPGEGGDYIVTISYINLHGIGKNATQEERIFVVSTPTSSIFEANKRLSTIIAYPIYFKHLKVLVLGENLAQDENHVRQILDGLDRDFVINKKVEIVIADGKAKDILEAVPKAVKQEEIEGSLFALLKNAKNTSRYTTKTLSGFIQGMDWGETIIPRVTVEDDDIKIFGGCIVKDYAVVGHIDEIESRSISFLNGQVRIELVDAPYKDGDISYQIATSKTKRKLLTNDKELTMEIDIEIGGALQEFILKDPTDTNGEGELKAMEEAINQELEEEINHALNLLQKKYKADTIGIGEYISKWHPKVWKEVSENWEEVFSEMDIKVSVDCKIRRRGIIE